MKLRNYIIAAAAVMMLAACSQPQGKKVAVVYFSKSGNTQAVAEEFAETLNSLTDQKDANLFRAELISLTPTTPYPEDYQATIEESRDECLQDLGRELTNAALKDTCQRVGGDPARKLGPTDRLIGSSLMALKEGITPAYITLGAAAALKRYLDEAGAEQGAEAAGKVLEEISRLGNTPEKKALRGMILDYYRMILSGVSLKDLRNAADRAKAASLKGII